MFGLNIYFYFGKWTEVKSYQAEKITILKYIPWTDSSNLLRLVVKKRSSCKF